MLIIFGGLPGTGKTTIARALAKQLEAVYLRIDSIEQAIRTSAFRPAGADIGPEGYFVACELAADNLRMGRTRTRSIRIYLLAKPIGPLRKPKKLASWR